MSIEENARLNRNNPTEPEWRLWRVLSRSQTGYKFRRQHVIGARIVDFFCPSVALVIEIDGHTHDADVDAARDAVSAAEGCTTLRFGNVDVMENLDGVYAMIVATAHSLPPREWHTPPPQPLP